MKRIIRLTESDLTRIVKRVINENKNNTRYYTNRNLRRLGRTPVVMVESIDEYAPLLSEGILDTVKEKISSLIDKSKTFIREKAEDLKDSIKDSFDKPLDEIITSIMLTMINEQEMIQTPSGEIIEIVFDWLEGIYNGQSPNTQRIIYSGFSVALQQINLNNGITPMNELVPWKVESLLLCLETYDELNKKKECPICLDEVKIINILRTNCNHDFCGECIMKKLDTDRSKCSPNCPMCRTDIKTMEIKCPEIYHEFCEKYSN